MYKYVPELVPSQKHGQVPFGTFSSKSVQMVSWTSAGERSFSPVAPNVLERLPPPWEHRDCTFSVVSRLNFKLTFSYFFPFFLPASLFSCAFFFFLAKQP